ncbi:MAG: RNA polymerase sigma factor [Acidimicrobiia bacterium]
MTATITAPDRVNGSGDDQAVSLADGTSLTWDQLILDFKPRLLSYAWSRGVREPEDLVQDVFVAAMACLGAFEGDRAALRSLLFAITYRRIADEHRRGYRRPEILTPDQSTFPDPGPSIDDVVSLHDEARLAMDAFSVLNRREQRVLEMRLLDEATPAEVAKALGLSNGNVRVIQARALVKVRHHLQDTLGRGSAISTPALGIPFEVIRGLRNRPARRGLVGEWVEWLKASPRSAAVATGSGGHERNVIDILARAGQTGHTISSVADSAGPAAAKIGALVTVLALGAGAGGHLMTQDEELAPVNAPAIEQAEPTPARRATEQRTDPEVTGTGAVDRIPALPAEPPFNFEQPAAPDERAPAAEPETAVTDPSGPGSDAAPVDDIVDDVVEPVVEEAGGLVEETVEVVEDTVKGAGETVAVVGEVAETVVEDVVIAAVEDTVDVVEGVTTPLVEESVNPILDEVGETLDNAVAGLGGLLGLP